MTNDYIESVIESVEIDGTTSPNDRLKEVSYEDLSEIRQQQAQSASGQPPQKMIDVIRYDNKKNVIQHNGFDIHG